MKAVQKLEQSHEVVGLLALKLSYKGVFPLFWLHENLEEHEILQVSRQVL